MRKTQVHTWIAMLFCVLAVAAEAVKSGAIHCRSEAKAAADAEPARARRGAVSLSRRRATRLLRARRRCRRRRTASTWWSRVRDGTDAGRCCAPSARATISSSSIAARRPTGVHIYRLSCTSREERPQFLTVAVRADYIRCGHVVFTADDLLSDRVRATGFAAVAPAKEFVCHLLRCIDAGAISSSDGELLSAQWRLDPQGVKKQVERFWRPDREGGVILRAAASGNWEAAQDCLRPLQSALRLRNIVPPLAWLREELTRLRSWFRPQGLLIACLGPPGSGKSQRDPGAERQAARRVRERAHDGAASRRDARRARSRQARARAGASPADASRRSSS